MIADVLSRLAVRVSDPAYDSRHAVLDITCELQAIAAESETLPAELAAEFRDLLNEVRQVQPVYPSRRETSPLFERGGLGQPGRERAERIVQRLVSLAKAVQRLPRR